MKTASDFPKLNLPPCRLRVSQREGELCVWDALRGCWLVLTGEEWVRRHVIALLGRGAAVRISQEHPVAAGGTIGRADVVLFGGEGRPLLVVECKAPGVRIDGETLAQAFRYNSVLGARYVMLTNGLDHYIYEVSADGGYVALKDFPEFLT